MREDVTERLLGGASGGLFTGVAVGVVTNTRDPDGLGRVRLTLPWLSQEVETTWARVAVPAAGAGSGAMFQPRAGDEVLVAFEHGDPGRPYVLGWLWNGRDKPPDANAQGKGDLQVIRSRSGHVVRLDDTQGKERIEVIDRTGKSSVVIDSATNTVTITGQQDVVVAAAAGKLTLRGKAGVEIASDAGVTVAAKSELKLTASGSAELNGGGALKLKAGTVDIN
jgi:uncharacterized protein involved in type VI secretion and phage assembly